MILDEVSKLPDKMAPEKLLPYFEGVTKYHQDHPELTVSTAEALFQLADRQWHTYQILTGRHREILVAWLKQVWDVNDLDLIEKLIFVIGALGLQECEYLLRDSLKLALREEVRTEIAGALEEFGDHLGDPYFGQSNP